MKLRIALMLCAFASGAVASVAGANTAHGHGHAGRHGATPAATTAP